MWRLVFARSFALINMEEDSPAVSGRWSPLSQSKDFSALLVKKGVKLCVLICQGQPGKILCLSPEKMTIFPQLAIFSTCPSQKSGTPTHFKITFLESARIELSLHKVLL